MLVKEADHAVQAPRIRVSASAPIEYYAPLGPTTFFFFTFARAENAKRSQPLFFSSAGLNWVKKKKKRKKKLTRQDHLHRARVIVDVLSPPHPRTERPFRLFPVRDSIRRFRRIIQRAEEPFEVIRK